MFPGIKNEDEFTDKKENLIFIICEEIQKGSVAKLYMTNDLLIQYMVKYLRIPHILGGPSSYI